jgi:hypothetical protein
MRSDWTSWAFFIDYAGMTVWSRNFDFCSRQKLYLASKSETSAEICGTFSKVTSLQSWADDNPRADSCTLNSRTIVISPDHEQTKLMERRCTLNCVTVLNSNLGHKLFATSLADSRFSWRTVIIFCVKTIVKIANMQLDFRSDIV